MDKYRFAVCDDEEAIRSLIAGWLSKSLYEAEIKEYDSGEELIRDIDAGIKFDILLFPSIILSLVLTIIFSEIGKATQIIFSFSKFKGKAVSLVYTILSKLFLRLCLVTLRFPFLISS